MPVTLYGSPQAACTRGILHFLEENPHINVEFKAVDFAKAENRSPEYLKINPFGKIPSLVDDDFVLLESSAIIKYIADKFDSPLYPKDLKKRALVNSRLDYFLTEVYPPIGYEVVYPQFLPHHKVLNDEILSKSKYLAGDSITIVDYIALSLISTAELVDTNFGKWPNITAWLERMKSTPGYAIAYAGLPGFKQSLKHLNLIPVA